MKLSISVTDERTKPKAAHYLADEVEEFTRAEVEGLTGSGAVLAAFLRGVADEIDPAKSQINAKADFGMTTR